MAAAHRAGETALAHARDPAGLGTVSKGVQDVVTAADKAVEQALPREIAEAFPGDAVLGEEEGLSPGWDGRAPLWILDPIDGTANFARRLPLWCVSIGVHSDGDAVCGVIHNPMAGETHAAARGSGGTMKGKPIRVSQATLPEHSRIGLGSSYRRERKLHVAAVDRLLALSFSDRRLQVNLLLNRTSPWADLDSYLPCQGKVVLHIKVPCDLRIRIPEWVQPQQVMCQVNSTDRNLGWEGRYALSGRVQPGDEVQLTFPIVERTESIWIEKHPYTFTLRGNNVVAVDPPGRVHPLYQRQHYRQAEPGFQTVTRFVSSEIAGANNL